MLHVSLGESRSVLPCYYMYVWVRVEICHVTTVCVGESRSVLTCYYMYVWVRERVCCHVSVTTCMCG